LTEIRSKWLKEKKIQSKVRESELLNKKTEEDRSTRNMDHGKLSKRKNPPMDYLEHLTGKKEG
jgi:hypothetical protein